MRGLGRGEAWREEGREGEKDGGRRERIYGEMEIISYYLEDFSGERCSCTGLLAPRGRTAIVDIKQHQKSDLQCALVKCSASERPSVV